MVHYFSEDELVEYGERIVNYFKKHFDLDISASLWYEDDDLKDITGFSHQTKITFKNREDMHLFKISCPKEVCTRYWIMDVER